MATEAGDGPALVSTSTTRPPSRSVTAPWRSGDADPTHWPSTYRSASPAIVPADSRPARVGSGVERRREIRDAAAFVRGAVRQRRRYTPGRCIGHPALPDPDH